MNLINKSYLVTLNQRVQGSKSLCAHQSSQQLGEPVSRTACAVCIQFADLFANRTRH